MTKELLKKLEYLDDDGVLWVGLLTATHPTKFSVAEVRVYRVELRDDETYHRLDGGFLAGVLGYVGVPELANNMGAGGSIPEHVRHGLGKAVKTIGLGKTG